MLEQLRDMICEYVAVDREEITEEARFIEDLGFTSYDFMSMVGEIEERYGVEVDEKKLAGVTTVGEAIEYIAKLQTT